jgi:hypothetical protein
MRDLWRTAIWDQKWEINILPRPVERRPGRKTFWWVYGQSGGLRSILPNSSTSDAPREPLPCIEMGEIHLITWMAIERGHAHNQGADRCDFRWNPGSESTVGPAPRTSPAVTATG